MRKYYFNENYFEKIDTEAKAYILGFIYADGCVYIDKKGNKRLTICIHKQDIEILNLIKKELNFNGSIYFYKNKPHVSLVVCGNKFSDFLIKQGCHPRKSFTLEFPSEDQVPNFLIKHFMRGFFDGDGSIYSTGMNFSYYSKYKKKETKSYYNYSGFAITAPFNFCKSFTSKIKEFIPELYSMKPCEKRGNKSPGIFNLTFRYKDTNNSKIINIFNWLYSDSVYFLSRKYNKFLECIANCKNNNIPQEEKSKKHSNSLQGVRSKNNCVSNFMGVSLSQNKYWKSTIMKLGKSYSRGAASETEAAKNYDIMARYLYGDTASFNFPEEVLNISLENLEKLFKEIIKINKTSKYKGVDYLRARGCWRAYFSIKNKRWVKFAQTEDDAGRYADGLKVIYSNSFDDLNFPENINLYKNITLDFFKTKRLQTPHGVKFLKETNKWQSGFYRRKQFIDCGIFDTKQEAVKIAIKKAEIFDTQYANSI